MEVVKIQRRLLEAGVTLHTSQAVTAVQASGVSVVNAYTGQPGTLEADSVVMVTARLPQDSLYLELWPGRYRPGKTVRGIGDAGRPVRSPRRSGQAVATPRSSTHPAPERRRAVPP